jgi:hypothetical protein
LDMFRFGEIHVEKLEFGRNPILLSCLLKSLVVGVIFHLRNLTTVSL